MKELNKFWLLMLVTSIISLVAIISQIAIYNDMWLTISLLFFGVITPILVLIFKNNINLSFLTTMVPTIIIIRIGDQNDISWVAWLTTLSLIPLLLQLIIISKDIYKRDQQELALTLIRLFLGFNWLTHGTEKLFAGTGVHDSMRGFFGQVAGFDAIGGAGFTNLMIYTGGIIEILVALLIAWGLFTRAGIILAILYLLAAQLFAGHFSIGYTWASPGGGWEFPFFWAMVLYPFLVLKNQGKLSFDSMKCNKS